MKINRKINVAQLTQELLPLSINSIVYDESSGELKIKSQSGNASESEIMEVINAHIPKKIKTRAEKRKDIENAMTLDDLKKSILEVI